MRSAAALAYEQAQAAIDGNARRRRPDRCSSRCFCRYGAPMASLTRARTERAPLDLDLPERKIQLDEQGRVRGVITPPRLDAHRLIEEFMIAANVAAAEDIGGQAHAADLSRARSALEGEARRALGVLSDLGRDAAEDRATQARSFQPHPRRDAGEPGGRARGRGGAAQPGSGRVQRRQFRPFRSELAALRALHLADPPLCRSHCAPGADPRAQARQ